MFFNVFGMILQILICFHFFLHPLPNPPINLFRHFSEQTYRACSYASALRAGLRHRIRSGTILDVGGFELLATSGAFEQAYSSEHSFTPYL